VLLERPAIAGIDVPLGVVGRVDLDVVAAELDEPVDDVLAEDARDVCNEVVRGRVCVRRVLGVPVDPVPARRRDRVLRTRVCARLEERELVRDDVAVDLEPPRHEGLLGRQRRRVGGLARASLPEAPPARVGVEELEATHRRSEERVVDDRDQRDPPVPSVLPVRDRLDPGSFLEGDRLEHRPVLRPTQLVGVDRPGERRLPRFPEVIGSQQASDDVCAHHRRRRPGRHRGLLRHWE
jgi:hypothetical protein